jgi:hypothetical protein
MWPERARSCRQRAGAVAIAVVVNPVHGSGRPDTLGEDHSQPAGAAVCVYAGHSHLLFGMFDVNSLRWDRWCSVGRLDGCQERTRRPMAWEASLILASLWGSPSRAVGNAVFEVVVQESECDAS